MALATLQDLRSLRTPESVIGKFVKVEGVFASWVSAICPFHEDRKASLSVKLSTGFFFCRGCAKTGEFPEIVRKCGTDKQRECIDRDPKSFSFPVRCYEYKDANSILKKVVVRYFPKDFRQFAVEGSILSSGNGKEASLLYNQDRIAKAAPGSTIWLVEGEKDADAVQAEGGLATTNSGGALSWSSRHAEAIRGFRVIAVADNDDAGKKRLRKLAQTLPDAEMGVLPQDKHDLADFLQAGYRLTDIPVQPIRSLMAAERGKLSETGTEVLRQRRQFPALIKTGFMPIDQTFGLRRGGALFLAGYPGMGKTCTVAQSVRGLIKAHRVLVLPFEEKTDVFQRRLLLADGKIPTLDAEISETLLASITGYDNLVFPKNFEDFPSDIDKIIPLVEEIYLADQIDVVVLDHIQELYAKGNASGHFMMTEILRRINELRRRLNVTWIIASQLKKPFSSGKTLKEDELPEPIFMDLKESGNLAGVATSIYIVHRTKGGSIIKCSKNRYGPRKRFSMELNPQRLIFEASEEEDLGLD